MPEALNEAAQRGAFEVLVAIALPKVLGTLRRSLRKEMLDRVAGGEPKTLTGHALGDIDRIMAQDFPAGLAFGSGGR